jgi:hypothetical protein
MYMYYMCGFDERHYFYYYKINVRENRRGNQQSCEEPLSKQYRNLVEFYYKKCVVNVFYPSSAPGWVTPGFFYVSFLLICLVFCAVLYFLFRLSSCCILCSQCYQCLDCPCKIHLQHTFYNKTQQDCGIVWKEVLHKTLSNVRYIFQIFTPWRWR